MAMTAGIPASLNLWCVELKTGNQVSIETKCDLDRVFKPIIKKWSMLRFQKVLLRNEVNNRRCQEIFTTLPLIVVDPSNMLPDKFKDLREESPCRCDKMLSLNIL